MDFPINSMVIFHSYVSSPEGTLYKQNVIFNSKLLNYQSVKTNAVANSYAPPAPPAPNQLSSDPWDNTFIGSKCLILKPFILY